MARLKCHPRGHRRATTQDGDAVRRAIAGRGGTGGRANRPLDGGASLRADAGTGPMSNDFAEETPRPDPATLARADHTIGSSTIYRLCEEVIALREMNNRQHKLFEQSLTKARDELRASFNSFAGDTQRAYQQLRQEVHGEKRISLALLNELLDLGMELEHITA